MGKETVLFKFEKKMDVQSVAAFLRDLADKIESRKVVLKQGQKQVKLKIPKTVELEIKAEREDGKRRSKKKLEVEIEWTLGQTDKGSFSLG